MTQSALKVYIGWDQRDIDAYSVCEFTMKEHSSIPLLVKPLKDWELRQKQVYWRPYHVDAGGQMWDGRDGKPFSTGFSFTRFCVPLLENYADEWVLFCDPDMLWRADVADLFDHVNPDLSVLCVKHDHVPLERTKMDGVIQTTYARKNWSSLMLMNPSRCTGLSKYATNNYSGSDLHAMVWVEDEQIGGLQEEWNWLEGWSSPEINPNVIHHTRGTPDMNPDVAYAGEWWDALARANGINLLKETA